MDRPIHRVDQRGYDRCVPGDILIRQLEYVAALAREQHFGRAARACHASQPALSAGIQRLEHELGVTIVQRGQRFVDFTGEGRLVVAWAHRLLAERDALHADLNRMRNGLTGTLRIGTIPTSVPVLPLLVHPFTRRHPHATVQVHTLASQDIVRRLAEFDLDIGLSYQDPDLSGISCVPLYTERYLLLTPRDGDLAGRTTITWAEAAQQPLCVLDSSMQNRRILDHAVATAGGSITPLVETDTVESLYGHAVTLGGCSIITHAWLHTFGIPTTMTTVPIDEPAPRPTVGVLTHEHQPQSFLASAALETIAELDITDQLNTNLPDP